MRLIKLKAMKRINGLHFTPDGRKLLAVGGRYANNADELRWVNVPVMTEWYRVPIYSFRYALSPDCTRLAVGSVPAFSGWDSPRPPLVVFDPTDPTWHEDESRWKELPLPAGSAAVGLAFLPDGDKLVVGFTIPGSAYSELFSRLAVLSVTAPESISLDDRANCPGLIVTSPDGSRFAACDHYSPREVTLFPVDSASPCSTFTPPGSPTRHLVFSPDSGTLAVAHAKSVFLITADSDVPRFTLAHPKQANQVAFTPDGRRILSACHDGLLRIWDAASGQLVTSYDWGIGQTTAVVVAPDGLTAAAAGQKGQVAVFDLD